MVVLIVLGSLGGGVLVLLLLAGFAAAIIIAVVLQKKSAPAGSEGNGSGSCSGSEGESATPPKWFVEMLSLGQEARARRRRIRRTMKKRNLLSKFLMRLLLCVLRVVVGQGTHRSFEYV